MFDRTFQIALLRLLLPPSDLQNRARHDLENWNELKAVFWMWVGRGWWGCCCEQCVLNTKQMLLVPGDSLGSLGVCRRACSVLGSTCASSQLWSLHGFTPPALSPCLSTAMCFETALGMVMCESPCIVSAVQGCGQFLCAFVTLCPSNDMQCQG